MDPRLQAIIEGILDRCIEEGEHKQVRSFTLTLSELPWVAGFAASLGH